MLFIKHLYQDYINDTTPMVIKGIEYLKNMIKCNGGKISFLASFKDIDQLKIGNISVDLIEVKPFQDAFQIFKAIV